MVQNVSINVTNRDGSETTVSAIVGHPLMEALRDEGLVEAICGGECACATCHVHIASSWMDKVGPANGQESEMLETSLEKRDTSRLSCQLIVTPKFAGLALEIAAAEG